MTAVSPQDLDPHIVPLESVVGTPLCDRAGDKLGVIKEIYVNRITGQVEFVLGATGGFLGVGEKFHPLPWSLLTYETSPDRYVGAFTKEQLKDAPAYDRDQLSSPHYGWADQVRRYFETAGRRP